MFLMRLWLGVVTVLLLPGFVLLHSWRGEAFRPIEALSLSFGLSLLLMVPLTLIAFACRLPADAVVLALVVWNIAASFRLFVLRAPARVRWESSQLMPLLVALLLTVLYYRWSDDVAQVGWEVGLHLAWARQYASAEPLGIGVSVVRPDLQVPNIFFLWEFALACVSRVSHLDIVPVFLRARALVPGLGLGALALMARAFLGTAGSRLDLSPVLALLVALRSLMLEPWPQTFSWLAREGRYPGFLVGSVHHSDTAMDVLLPLLLAALFAFLRSGRGLHAGLLAAGLTAGFFWHPREYFQVVWYGVIAALVDLVLRSAGRRGFAPLKRHAGLGAVLLGVTALLIAISHGASSSRDSTAELQTKVRVVGAVGRGLEDPVPFLSAHSPWRAPTLVMAGTSSLKTQPPQVFSFMMLSVLSAAVLAGFGRRREVWLAAFFLTLWWLTLCVPVIQQLLILATYSEILVSQMRFLIAPAFLLVGLGLFRCGSAVMTRFTRTGPLVALALGLSWALLWTWEGDGSWLRMGVLNALFLGSAALVAWRLDRRAPGDSPSRLGRPRAASIGWMILFLLPASVHTGSLPVAAWWDLHRDPMSLFGDSNPSGLSPALIDHFRSRVPARSMVQVFPGHRLVPSSPPAAADDVRPLSMPSLFAPIYQRPLIGSIHLDAQEFRDARAGRHAVYSILTEDACASGRLLLVARARGLDFILLQDRYYRSASCLSDRDPDHFFVSFDNPSHREALLGVRREAR
jgi:hypothetical protein